MADTRIIKIFLASSSELKDDREQFEIFINRKNKEYIKKDIFLELVLWEDFPDYMSATRLQDEYNKAITDCDVFISLFNTKVGQYTEEEFLKALETFKLNNKLLIYTYFKNSPIYTDQITDEISSLLDFKKKLRELEHFYKSYKEISELKYLFDQQLNKFILQLINNIEDVTKVKKQQPEKFLQSRINQLEELLERERSQNQQLRDLEQSYQAQIKQLEQLLETERSQLAKQQANFQSAQEKISVSKRKYITA